MALGPNLTGGANLNAPAGSCLATTAKTLAPALLEALPRGVRSRIAGWAVDAFDTGALPHFERRAAFMAAYMRFLDSLSEGS